MFRRHLAVFWAFSAAVIVGLTWAPSKASAATIACNGNCNWSIDAGGEEVLSGTYEIAGDGSLILTPGQVLSVNLSDGSSVAVNDLSGNIDPILGFSVAAGTAGAGKTFAFNFSLPINLSGSINASSSVSYSLTSLSNAGAQISPLLGQHIVIAQEVDSSVGGLNPLNKGVDVGDKFSFSGGPKVMNSPVFSAANMFTGNSAYDLMSITVAFTLSANSQVGLSGFVQQEPTVVPLPAALPLLLWGLSGLGGMLGFSRRSSLRAA